MRTFNKLLCHVFSSYTISLYFPPSMLLIQQWNLIGLRKVILTFDITLSSQIIQRAIRVLEGHIITIQDEAIQQYAKMINIMTTLNSYYPEDLRWDRAARTLDIWRKPTADINTPAILRQAIKKAETWRVWPKSKSKFTYSILTNIAILFSVYIT